MDHRWVNSRSAQMGQFCVGVNIFGDRAAKLQEKGLTKGQEIEVVGCLHERQVKSSAEGQGTKTVRELYATAIRTTLRKATDGDSS